MDVEDENRQPYISLDRVEGIDLEREHVQCYLCHGLVWHPVTCRYCDTVFCLQCIQELHRARLEQICPRGCLTYNERQNPAIIMHLLAGLKIICQYKSNGCEKILLYNELENHENNCDYQLFICQGCQQGIIKKDFDQHQIECEFVLITCNECFISFQRREKESHTLTECLRRQVQKLQIKLINQEEKINFLEQKLKQNDNRWNEFMLTTQAVKDQFDQQLQSIEN